MFPVVGVEPLVWSNMTGLRGPAASASPGGPFQGVFVVFMLKTVPESAAALRMPLVTWNLGLGGQGDEETLLVFVHGQLGRW